MKSEYVVQRQSPATKAVCQEVVDIFAEAVARAAKGSASCHLRKTVGAEVLGMTACPCAQEIMKEEVRRELAKAGLSEQAAFDLAESCRWPPTTRGEGAAYPWRSTTGAASPSTRS